MLNDRLQGAFNYVMIASRIVDFAQDDSVCCKVPMVKKIDHSMI
jgi:hypothetical protein